MLRMRAALRGIIFSTTFTFILFPQNGNAQQTPPQVVALPPIEVKAVSPTLIETPVEQIGNSVTVISREEIERKQQRTVPDLLKDVPGLNVVQTGGPGGQTSIFLRGANSNHTKVLIDGIEVGDPSVPNAAFDFGNLLTYDIERIEILRGPQSGLYGSDAIGGVIDIRTRKGSGPARVTGILEGGTYGTFNQYTGVNGSSGPISYSFNATHSSVDGVPVTPLDLLPPGRVRNADSYDNQTYSAKVGVDISSDLDVGFSARHIATTLKFTGTDYSTFPAAPAASQSENNTEQWFTRGFVHHSAWNGAFDQTFGVNYTDYKRRDVSIFGVNPNNGDRLSYDWLGLIKTVPGQTLSLGAEHKIDRITDSPISAENANTAGFMQLQSEFGGRFFNSIAVRYDENERFGGAATYRVAPVLLLQETNTKLKASYGTAFKAPTLNQLFVSYPDPFFPFFANPNLKPEESEGYDIGFEQSLLSKLQFGVTYFHNDIRNLIAPNDTFTTNINIGRAKTYGIESFVAFQPLSNLAFRTDYTYTIAENADTKLELLRRPKHKVSVNASWQVDEKLNLSATFIHVGSFVDGNRDFSVPRLKADGYSLVNLAGSYDFGDGLTAFSRIDNLFDERYENPTGFQRPGLAAYGGLKVEMSAADLGRKLD